VSANIVPVDVPTTVLVDPVTRSTSYPLRGLVPAAEAVQVRVAPDAVTDAATGVPGVVGGMTPSGGAAVVNVPADDAAETFPATSFALTVYEYAVLGVRPDRIVEGDVVDATSVEVDPCTR
jgi:hypothetical protein